MFRETAIVVMTKGLISVNKFLLAQRDFEAGSESEWPPEKSHRSQVNKMPLNRALG